MADHFGVVPEALTAHASGLQSVADALQQAVDAARLVSLPEDAYGQICQFVPPMINPVEQNGVEAITSGVTAVQATMTGVRRSAQTYQASDEANRHSFGPGAIP